MLNASCAGWLRRARLLTSPFVVTSVVCTLFLCILGWATYNWRVKEKDRKEKAWKEDPNIGVSEIPGVKI